MAAAKVAMRERTAATDRQAPAVRRAPRAPAAQGAAPMALKGCWVGAGTPALKAKVAVAAAACTAVAAAETNRAAEVDPGGSNLVPQGGSATLTQGTTVAPSVSISYKAGGVGEEPPPTEQPQSKEECKKGGYEEFGFKNQGRCIKAVNHPS